MMAVFILIAIAVIMVVTPKDGAREGSSGGIFSNFEASNTSNQTIGQGTPSSPSQELPRISISAGNASYAFQPNIEYISLYNSGRDPVDITGWQLKNGKENRVYYLGGSLQRFSSDTATIPQAANFISPSGPSILRNLILGPGETAIITTGQVGSSIPYSIVSFKENICSGYLEEMPEYSFTPSLTRNCPRPANEPGLENLDIPCRKFIERLPSCRTPIFDTKDRQGNPCNTCINGERLSSVCAAFIKERINYGSCIMRYKDEPNFSGRTWRVFLGQGWEMWANEYETIELFDRLGRLINSRSY